MLILLYGCTTCTKSLDNKLDWNYTRMLPTVFHKSWKQHPTKKQLYSHRSTPSHKISKGWIKHAGYHWRSKDEFGCNVLLWTPTHGHNGTGLPAKTNIPQLCANTNNHQVDLPTAMVDRLGSCAIPKGIRAFVTLDAESKTLDFQTIRLHFGCTTYKDY